jgi:cytochrome c biogenesis protein CcmG/thiol:disulfide interchange protein DsbE
MIGRSALVACVLALAPAAAQAATPVVGEPAPDFSMRTLDGQTLTLADVKGQVVILNLWATWCGPCRAEMPTLDLLQVNGYPHGLRIYGVLVNDPQAEGRLGKIQKVLHYPLAKRISGSYKPIKGAVPTNYIIDRRGIVRYARAASLTKDAFIELVLPLLNERAE